MKIEDAISYFDEGNVELTSRGNFENRTNLIMQRKGGDGGRGTAKQLHLKSSSRTFDVK